MWLCHGTAAIARFRVIGVERRRGTESAAVVLYWVHPEVDRRFMAALAGQSRHGQMVDARAGPGHEVGGRVAALARDGGVPTGMWVAGIPVAATPLWQLAQLLVTPLWVKNAPAQVSVVWAGIALEVGDDVLGSLALCLHTVVAGRAVAAHLGVVKVDRRFPGDGVWQLAHRSVDRMWLAGLAVARTVVPMP